MKCTTMPKDMQTHSSEFTVRYWYSSIFIDKLSKGLNKAVSTVCFLGTSSLSQIYFLGQNASLKLGTMTALL